MATKTSRERPSGADAEEVELLRAAAGYGIAVSQLRDNPALKVAEQLRRHRTTLDTVEMLQKARRL
jgi:hypothetical protein